MMGSKLVVGGVIVVLNLAAVVYAVEPLPDSVRQAPLIFVATLAKAQAGPVANSFPPIYTYRLTFEDAGKPLRGTLPDELHFAYSVRTVDPPEFSEGSKYLVAVRSGEGARVVALLPASDDLLKRAREELSLPVGWRREGGKLVSPWVARGENAWPKDSPLTAERKCSATGRPALLAGEGIVMSVEQVPPAELQKFKNPFGDGQFKITVTNKGKMATSVPALVRDGGDIRWHDSLVIICRDAPFLLPASAPLKNPTPVELGPGESVTTTIDTLLLPGDVPWPRGGSRIAFTFALGDVASDNFFYYFSALHDDMRAAHQKAFAAGTGSKE